MIRVVLDTNVYISALMFGGLPGLLLDLALVKSFLVLISPALLEELDEKLRLKFGIASEDMAIIHTKLETFTEIVRPTISLQVVEDDPDDDRVLECAIQGRADFIVTGDRHLLKLSTYKGIPILTVRRFLEQMNA